MPTARRKGRQVKLSPSELDQLYPARHFFGTGVEEKLEFRKKVDVYLQDPQVGKTEPDLEFDDDCMVDLEPGLADGPTSARFAVVDYNVDAETLAPPARWDDDARHYSDDDGEAITRAQAGTMQFDQVNAWALLQRALRFFEQPQGLGRPLPWGFDGNRLIVVPHAGYGENAFYDRESKSLQFYYFDRRGERIYTCRSADIVHHEFGHAVLDGVRPYLYESASVETGAFHESIGDITAILLLMRNNDFRRDLAEKTQGDLTAAAHLSAIAEQFGTEVLDRPYLRSARNQLTLQQVADSDVGHHVSQVLTAAIFDLLIELSRVYLEARSKTAAQALAYTILRVQRMVIQALDFLPPIDVTFRDYALAMLRAHQLANPVDPYDYRDVMLRIFVRRGILGADEAEQLKQADYLLDRGDWRYFHDVRRIGSSRAAAYRFLDDNRKDLGIPWNADVHVADLYTADKAGRQNRRLPQQTVLEYIWREELPLEGEAFGRMKGRMASFPCGGTLVFDETGLLYRTAKDGRGSAAGDQRAERHLADIGQRIQARQLGTVAGGARGFIASRVPPFVVADDGGTLRFHLSPHLNLSTSHDHEEGGYPWEMSF